MEALIVILAIISIIIGIPFYKLYSAKTEIRLLQHTIEESRASLKNIVTEFEEFKEKTKHLRQYEVIVDAKAEARNILNQASYELNTTKSQSESIKLEADLQSEATVQSAKDKAKLIRQKANDALSHATQVAHDIQSNANEKAKEIAGDAWEAKQNAEQFEETARAMKNIIRGYGDEYLVPNESALDEIAEEYSHNELGKQLAELRSSLKTMIKQHQAADCDYVEHIRRTAAIEFVLDAFNGKVDTIMGKVKHNNYGKLLQQLKDAFRLVNHNGQPFRNARINQSYFDVVEKQLKAAVGVHELKKIDQEEQRRIREEMREEERARRDFEKAIKAAEKEEKLLQKAMKKAEEKLAGAAAEERSQFEAQLEALRGKLDEAEQNGKRALSMAQQTRQGHVYVISNIGSFGGNVFKIGLTRRLIPEDRIKELGDASVPFPFDVHAMIHSKDAPALEKKLHTVFSENRKNKVNLRKEFFDVSLGSIRAELDKLELNAYFAESEQPFR